MLRTDTPYRTPAPRRGPLTFKLVMRLDPAWPKLRLFRVTWSVGTVGDGKGYSRKVAFAIRPALWRSAKSHGQWRIVLIGLEVHSETSWGGRFV